jgi:hypothetical protein
LAALLHQDFSSSSSSFKNIDTGLAIHCLLNLHQSSQHNKASCHTQGSHRETTFHLQSPDPLVKSQKLKIIHIRPLASMMSSQTTYPKKNNRFSAAKHSRQPANIPRGPSLLGIDQQCRDLILDMVLLNKSGPWDDNIIDPNIEPVHLSIPWVGESNTSPSPYKISNVRIHVCNVNILRACHQLCLEGKVVLYGRNSFVSYNFPQLKYRLHTVIGRSNMSLIKHVTIGLPMKHKRDPTPYLGGFLEFFKEKLPNLIELTLTTQFWRSDNVLDRQSDNTRFGEEYRAMLNTSAWVTCRHPQLKKAVWLVESGGIKRVPQPIYDDWSGGSGQESELEGSTEDSNDNAGIWTVVTQFASIAAFDGGLNNNENDVIGTAANEISKGTNGADDFGRDMTYDVDLCRLTVKILAVDRRFKLREQPRIDLIPRITKVVARVSTLTSVMLEAAD